MAARYLAFPTLMLGSLLLGLVGLRLGLPRTPLLVGILLGCLGVQLVLERVIPYRRDWSGQRRLGEDLTCMGLNAITQQVVDVLVLAGVFAGAAALRDGLGASLWPTSWPLVPQLVLAVLVADLGHYVAHRLLHRVPWMWAFHAMHHSPSSLDSTNFYRMHPFDIVVKAILNTAPLVLLGTPGEVLALWMILSGVSAGSVNHANIDLRTGWLDGILSTPTLHRVHHSRAETEHGANLGNITVLYDRLFGTYRRPHHDVAEVGIAGGARPLVVELLEPVTRRGR
jgi:ornithine lipid hydroxylase